MSDSPERAVHDALGGMLDEGEIVMRWMLVIDVIGPDNTRYLSHRAGGGHDGTDKPAAWEAVGMLQASLDIARDQIREMTMDVDEDADEDNA